MTLAGLWTTWKDSDGSLLQTCTIITVEATNKLAEIHHRMPVILERENVDLWLDVNQSLPTDLLLAAPDEVLISGPTNRLDRAGRVNDANHASTSKLDDDLLGRLF